FDKQLRATDAELGRVVNGMAQITEDRREFRSKSLRFLASTPPIQGLVRALQNNGFDPVGTSTSAEWERRMQQIFTGYMGSSPEVRRLRFIHATDNGRELVR